MELKIILAIIIPIVLIGIILFIDKWRELVKTNRFRKNLKPGDYCHFYNKGALVLGRVISIRENVKIQYYDSFLKLKIYEIYP